MLIASYDCYLKNREHVLNSNWASPYKSAMKHGILNLAIRLL